MIAALSTFCAGFLGSIGKAGVPKAGEDEGIGFVGSGNVLDRCVLGLGVTADVSAIFEA